MKFFLSLSLLCSFLFASFVGAADVTVTTDAASGLGSLAEAIDSASSGDVISFDTGVTSISLDNSSSAQSITTDITINGGVAGITIDGTSANDPLLQLSTYSHSTLFLSGEVTIDGIIEGDGVLAISSGEVTLSGANTFTGGLNLNEGIAEISSVGALGDLGTTLKFTDINPKSGLAIEDATTATLKLGSSFSDSTLAQKMTISNGFTAVIDTNGKDLEISEKITGTGVNGQGTGSLEKTGAGTLTLSSIDNYIGNNGSGGIIINEGTLAITKSLSITSDFTFTGDSTLQLPSDVSNFDITYPITISGDGMTIATLDNAGDITLSGVISGGISTSEVVKSGAGTMTLSNESNSFGALTIQEGTVVISSADASGGGDISFESDDPVTSTSATLQLGSNFADTALSNDIIIGSDFTATIDTNGHDLEISGSLSGGASATFVKIGSDTLTLSADSTDFSGSINITAGTLDIQGDVPVEITVAAGTTFGGNPTIESLINNGTVQPGNSIGTITITGDYTQDADAILEIEVGLDGSGDPTSDQLIVGGTASLDGTLVLDSDVSLIPSGSTVTFLTAAAINNTWSTVNDDNFFYSYTLDTDATTASITINDPLVTGNARSVFDELGANLDNASAAMEEVITNLGTLSLAELQATLNRMHPALKGANVMVLESNATLVDDYINSINGSTLFTMSELNDNDKESEKDITYWTKAFRNQLNINATQDLPSLDSYSYVFALGGEKQYSANALGAYVGYQFSHLDWANGLADEKIHSYFLGGYQKYTGKRFSEFLSARVGVNTLKTNRHVSIADDTFSPHQSHHAVEWNIRAGIAYLCPLESMDLTPFLKASYFGVLEQGYTEKGGAPINLRIKRKTTNLARSQIGVKLSRNIRVENDYENGWIIPSLNLAADVLVPFGSQNYTSGFQGFPTHFNTKTYHKTWVFASPSARIELKGASGASFALGYKARFNRVYRNQTVDARLNWMF